MGRVGRSSSQTAFTLVEALVAGFVLVIAALGLASTLAQGSRITDASREEMIARNAIRSMAAELRSVPFDRVASTFDGKGFPVPPLHASREDPDGMPGAIRFEYGPGMNREFYRVTILVEWKGRSGARVIESTEYLANVRGDTGTPPPLGTTNVDPATDTTNWN